MSKLTVRTRYGTTPVELLNLNTVTLKAKGLYAFLQSKPDGWKFTLKGIVSQLKESFEATRSAIKELEIAGFLQRTNYQNEFGQWDCDYELFDSKSDCTPLSKIITTEKPYAEKPHAENPVSVKPPCIVNDTKSKIEQVRKVKGIKNNTKKNLSETVDNVNQPIPPQDLASLQNIIDQLSSYSDLSVSPKPWIMSLAKTIEVNNLLEPFLVFLEGKKLSDFKLTEYFLRKEKDTSEVWKHFINARKYQAKQLGASNSTYNTAKPGINRLILTEDNIGLIF